MTVELDAAGKVLNSSGPDTVRCRTCRDGTAAHQASLFRGTGVVTHHYRCKECPAAGALVDRDGERSRSVGPVFSGLHPDIRKRKDIPDPPLDGEERLRSVDVCKERRTRAGL